MQAILPTMAFYGLGLILPTVMLACGIAVFAWAPRVEGWRRRTLVPTVERYLGKELGLRPDEVDLMSYGAGEHGRRHAIIFTRVAGALIVVMTSGWLIVILTILHRLLHWPS